MAGLSPPPNENEAVAFGLSPPKLKLGVAVLAGFDAPKVLAGRFDPPPPKLKPLDCFCSAGFAIKLGLSVLFPNEKLDCVVDVLAPKVDGAVVSGFAPPPKLNDGAAEAVVAAGAPPNENDGAAGLGG